VLMAGQVISSMRMVFILAFSFASFVPAQFVL